MHLIPAIHPYIGGASGVGHSSNYQVKDPEMFYIAPTKAMAMTIIDLLYDDAAVAQGIIKNFEPIYKNKEEYLKAWQEIAK